MWGECRLMGEEKGRSIILLTIEINFLNNATLLQQSVDIGYKHRTENT